MKALIWIGCLGVFAAVEGISVLLGYELGVAPTILLAAACFLLARVLSLRLDERQKQQRTKARKKPPAKK